MATDGAKKGILQRALQWQILPLNWVMSNYAIIPRLGVYYFAIQKKTKFVPLFKISKVNGTTSEEFHKLIEQIKINLKDDTTRKSNQPTNPRENRPRRSNA
jgi:hypothetical protein